MERAPQSASLDALCQVALHGLTEEPKGGDSSAKTSASPRARRRKQPSENIYAKKYPDVKKCRICVRGLKVDSPESRTVRSGEVGGDRNKRRVTRVTRQKEIAPSQGERSTRSAIQSKPPMMNSSLIPDLTRRIALANEVILSNQFFLYLLQHAEGDRIASFLESHQYEFHNPRLNQINVYSRTTVNRNVPVAPGIHPTPLQLLLIEALIKEANRKESQNLSPVRTAPVARITHEGNKSPSIAPKLLPNVKTSKWSEAEGNGEEIENSSNDEFCCRRVVPCERGG